MTPVILSGERIRRRHVEVAGVREGRVAKPGRGLLIATGMFGCGAAILLFALSLILSAVGESPVDRIARESSPALSTARTASEVYSASLLREGRTTSETCPQVAPLLRRMTTDRAFDRDELKELRAAAIGAGCDVP